MMHKSRDEYKHERKKVSNESKLREKPLRLKEILLLLNVPEGYQSNGNQNKYKNVTKHG